MVMLADGTGYTKTTPCGCWALKQSFQGEYQNFTPEEEDKIRQLFASGKRYREIANELKIDLAQVYEIVNQVIIRSGEKIVSTNITLPKRFGGVYGSEKKYYTHHKSRYLSRKIFRLHDSTRFEIQFQSNNLSEIQDFKKRLYSITKRIGKEELYKEYKRLGIKALREIIKKEKIGEVIE